VEPIEHESMINETANELDMLVTVSRIGPHFAHISAIRRTEAQHFFLKMSR